MSTRKITLVAILAVMLLGSGQLLLAGETMSQKETLDKFRGTGNWDQSEGEANQPSLAPPSGIQTKPKDELIKGMVGTGSWDQSEGEANQPSLAPPGGLHEETKSEYLKEFQGTGNWDQSEPQ